MSFSMQVAGHAGSGMQPTDEDEGEAVKSFITDILAVAKRHNLNLSVHGVSPGKWAPTKLNNLGHT